MARVCSGGTGALFLGSWGRGGCVAAHGYVLRLGSGAVEGCVWVRGAHWDESAGSGARRAEAGGGLTG